MRMVLRTKVVLSQSTKRAYSTVILVSSHSLIVRRFMTTLPILVASVTTTTMMLNFTLPDHISSTILPKLDLVSLRLLELDLSSWRNPRSEKSLLPLLQLCSLTLQALISKSSLHLSTAYTSMTATKTLMPSTLLILKECTILTVSSLTADMSTQSTVSSCTAVLHSQLVEYSGSRTTPPIRITSPTSKTMLESMEELFYVKDAN